MSIENPSAPPVDADQTFPCLGFEYLGRCHYNPLHPPTSYFSIGEGIASITIFIAVYSMLRTRHLFRLRVSPWYLPTVAILFLLGVVATWVAALLPAITKTAQPWTYPISWELLAGALIFTAIAVTVYRLARPIHFTGWNKGRFLNASMRIIASGRDSELSELADEVAAGADSLVDAAGAADLRRSSNDEERPDSRLEAKARYAYTCMVALADPAFCRVAVAHNPWMATKLAKAILGRYSSEDWGRPLMQELVRQALLSPDSVMRREAGYSGLGTFKNFQLSVFGSYSHISGGCDPLGAWRSHDKAEVNPEVCQAYADALLQGLASYFSARNHRYYSTQNLKNAFEKLTHSYRFALLKESEKDVDSLRNSQAYKCASIGQRTIVSAMQLLSQNDSRLPYVGRPDPSQPKARDMSIYQCLAEASFDHIEALSWCKKHSESLRDLLITIWLEIAPVPGQENIPTLKIQDRIQILLGKRLKENFVDGAYTPITRALLTVVDVGPPHGAQSFLQETLRTAMRSMFLDAVARGDDPKLYLPDYLEFDVDDCSLVRTRSGRRGSSITYRISLRS